MKDAVFAGSFDPVTVGHLEIVRRLGDVFDRVYFLLAVNSDKHCFFTRQERLDMMRAASAPMPFVVVDYTDGYVYEYARKKGAVLARGVRNADDFAYERVMADNNHGWAPEIQTVFLMADPALRDVSSTHARDLILSGKISDSLLPPVAAAYIAAIPDLEERRIAFGKQ